MLLEASHLWPTRMCMLVPNQCWHCCVALLSAVVKLRCHTEVHPSGWEDTEQAMALNLLDKTLQVSKAICIPGVTKYFYPLLFVAFFFSVPQWFYLCYNIFISLLKWSLVCLFWACGWGRGSSLVCIGVCFYFTKDLKQVWAVLLWKIYKWGPSLYSKCFGHLLMMTVWKMPNIKTWGTVAWLNCTKILPTSFSYWMVGLFSSLCGWRGEELCKSNTVRVIMTMFWQHCHCYYGAFFNLV